MGAQSKQPNPRRRQLSAEAITLQEKLLTRPSRDELVTRSIIRRQCGVIYNQGDSHKSGPWSWQRAIDASVTTAAAGLTFFVFISSNGDLLSVGTPQTVQFESLFAIGRAKTKRKALCHPPKSAHRDLLPTEAAILSPSLPTVQFPIRTNLLPSSSHSVRQIACGLSHCVALSVNSSGQLELRSWGIGDEGQLGLGNEQLVATVMTPISTSIDLQKALTSCEDHKSIYLRCGPVSSCVVISHSSCSVVWIWGSMPPIPDVWFEPTSGVIPSCDFSVQDVSVGLSHIAFVSRQGELFSWGATNNHAQLGIGLDHDHGRNLRGELHRVLLHHSDVHISQVCCGFSHTLALSEDGSRVFAWGSNRFGACGANTKFFDYFSPVLVPLRNALISSISCCGHTSVAFLKSETTEAPRAMIWGCTGSRVAHLLPKEFSLPEQTWSQLGGGAAIYGGLLLLHDENVSEVTTTLQVEGPQRALDDLQRFSRKRSEEPCLLGVNVAPSSQSSRLGDLRWTRLTSGRLRVFKSDSVVILLRQKAADEFTLQPMRTEIDQCPSRLITLPVAGAVGLYTLVVPVMSTGSYQLLWVDQDSCRVFDVLRIDCCQHPRMRNSTLQRHQGFLRSCYEEARKKNPIFLQLVARNNEVDEAIRFSPLAATKTDFYDIDRTSYEVAVRLSRPDKRGFTTDFALWSDFLVSDGSHFDQEENLMVTPEGLELRDLLQIDETLRLEMTFVAIANTVVCHGVDTSVPDVSQTDTSQSTAAKLTKSRNSSLTSLTVPQTALEFLVTGCRSQTELQQAVVPEEHTRLVLGVCSWTNERRDRFYSAQETAHATLNVVQVHLPDDIGVGMRRSCLDQLTFAIHSFLWERLDADLLDISELYTIFGDATDAIAFKSSLERHGFQLRIELSREEWYSVFRAIRSQCRPKPVPQLTLHALRLFMMDPFHGEFWRHYVADWCDAVRRQHSRWRVGDALTQAFPWMRDKLGCIDWQEFVVGIKTLHEAVSWELSDADTCRLLYRLDRRNDGRIAVEGFFRLLIQEATNISTMAPHIPVRRKRGKRAVASAWRRPDVEKFSTSDAVRKLFTARARVVDDTDNAAERDRLLRVGNSHLARIRSLPVTRLLSEGVHFRPTSSSSSAL